jgi:hypothetical protein
MNRIIRRSAFIVSVFVLLILPCTVFAESVFMKDGSIIEGKVIRDSDRAVLVKLADGSDKEIPRKDILRIIFDEEYKNKRYIYKMDGTSLEAFIVEEDKSGYTLRTDLDSAYEFKILKKDVDSISRRKVVSPAPQVKKAEPSREENIRSSATRMRLGFGRPTPNQLQSMNAEAVAINLDAFWFRTRNADGNGFDFLTRFNLKGHSNPQIDGVYVKSKFGIDTASGWQSDGGALLQFGFGAGARYIQGFYLGGAFWQGYLMAYYQYSLVDLKLTGSVFPDPNSSTTHHYVNSNGIVGGVGLEIALFTNFGLFTEYTYGYSPAFSTNVNIEGGLLRFGVTLRTSLPE